MPRDPECTFALLELGEAEFKRAFGSASPVNAPKNFQERIRSAAGVVIQPILHDACENAGIKILDAQFDEITKGFHIIVMFGICLSMSIVFLLKEEGQDVDVKELGQGMVGALLLMRSYEDRQERYELAHTLLMRFVSAGPKATEWQTNLNRLMSMYLLSSRYERLRRYNYASLFGSMLKVIFSAVELPS